MRAFLKRKGIDLSWRTYIITAFSYMTLGLFASLLIGLIIQTLGNQLGIEFLVDMGTLAMGLLGPAIGAAVAYGLGAPPLVLFAAIVSGAAGVELGGPAGAFLASVLAVECGKIVSKETKFDILLTPFVTVAVGYTVAVLIGPPIDSAMREFGGLINWATEQEPLIMSMVVAGLMGLALTAPVSSAAIAIMIDLNGLAAGAATIGCCARIGFAVSSFRENRTSGLISMGIGTSMLQVPNIVKNPWILVPPTVTGILLAPIAVIYFGMINNAEGAGMGTSGFVGQIMTLTSMGFTMDVFILILLFHFVLPALLAFFLSELMRKMRLIKFGDMKLEQ
ncbi:LOW QUALITY PROTEIN: predicted nicotinate-regulated transporter [Geomicrobium sp. JCM 19038]|nr:LOW QUALITY PROTEIN: predicted nicotinate-regulated transporter [Geomicrobium sp. JCM 19055]GAK07647.1 LOW QUALITY PROTEIN: predicted nicotinate-regulated transporter [Geomicrobium sp. JCM 19038]